MDFACRALVVAATLALGAPLASLAEESDTPAVEPGSGAAEKKPTRSDPPETELRELRVQAAPETDSFRATEPTRAHWASAPCWTRRSTSSATTRPLPGEICRFHSANQRASSSPSRPSPTAATGSTPRTPSGH